MNEAVKRVALAIQAAGNTCEWCHNPMPFDCCCYDGARAAIEAMREPTQDMLDDAFDYRGFDKESLASKKQELADDWAAMIDAALRD